MNAELEALLAASRRQLGCLAGDVPAGTAVADWLSISRVVEATGDDNPLYLDVAHGARSWWRTLIAPPAFVLAIRVPESTGALGAGAPAGVMDLLARVELWWDDHVKLGDRVAAELRLAAAGPGPAWRGRETLELTSRAVYRAEGRAVASAAGTVRVFPFAAGREQLVPRPMHRYEPDELARIEAALDAEAPARGERTRFHEDVADGERLPTRVRGPFTWSELITWHVAAGRPHPAGNLRHRALAATPGDVRPHGATGWPAASRRFAREDLTACADAGLPAPLVGGAFVVALLAQHVTSWMGDDAFLRHLAVSLDEPALYGDTLWLDGRVTDRFVQRSGAREDAAVALELACVNQLGQTVAAASAIVLLPARGRPIALPIAGERP